MHLIFLTEGPESQHKQFVKWINSKRYKEEGKYRTGDVVPHVSEVKIYDIRIKASAKDRFLQDLQNQIGLTTNTGNVKKHLGKTLDRLYWLLSKFTSLKRIIIPERTEPRNPKEFRGWFYVVPLGMIEDPVNKEGEEWL